MRKVDVKVVIGSNYGDEGKGLATHYFSKKATEQNKSCVNVLYNGSCQRGHTVELKDRRRHVFHHFGSGTFDCADTYFDKDFMVNPTAFYSEFIDLQHNFRRIPRCYISPKCRVVTPYDMFINQVVEKSRGDNRHGTCGFGVWETQKRYEDGEFALTYGDLISMSDEELNWYFINLAVSYSKRRLADYGIADARPSQEFLYNLFSQRYIPELRFMEKNTTIVSFNDIFKTHDSIIFEGGQGLALDEGNTEAFPHVTASKTGSLIPVTRMEMYSCDLEICYATRSYFTRHGEGGFPTECGITEINPEIQDRTNAPNDFQGTIRYGMFDKDEFLRRVEQDRQKSMAVNPDLKTSMLVTHLNYTGDIAGNTTVEELGKKFNNVYLSRTRYADDITR